MLSQVTGSLSLWASIPSFLATYLYYSMFENSNPEGFVTDVPVGISQIS
jgi:hypothetical protein